MRLTYDPDVNAAYVDLTRGGVRPGQASRQQHSIATPNGGELVLDYDDGGLLVGVEVLHADRVLAADTLDEAPPPGCC